MERPRKFRAHLVGVAAGVFAALLIWPSTHWLVCGQLASLVPGRPSAAVWSAGAVGRKAPGYDWATRAMHRAAARMPDDFAVQLANAVTPSANGALESEEKVARLRDLARRFADRPSIYANTLRFAALSLVKIRRDEEYLVVSGSHPRNRPQGASTEDQLEAFDRDAAEGERLDPDNGYFPCLRAIGLFAGHRDAQALQALHRAAQRPLWVEYYDDELEGENRLQAAAFADSGALPRVGIAAAILFPHYAQLRAVARLAVASAMRAEKSGRIAEGVAIRDDVLRCGGLIRAESRALIGSLVGSAMEECALQRPGGAAIVTPDAARPSGLSVRERLVAQYDAFLKRTGQLEKSTRVHAEVAAITEVRAICSVDRDRDLLGATVWQLGLSWWLNLLTLCAIIWTLFLGGAAAAAYRVRRLREGFGLPGWMGRGAALGCFAALLSCVVLVPSATPSTPLWCGAIVGFALAATLLPAKRGFERLRTLAAYLISLVVCGGVLLLYSLHVATTTGPLQSIVLTLSGRLDQAQQAIDPRFALLLSGSSVTDLGIHLAGIVIAGAVPSLLALAFIIAGIVNGVPISVAIVRGYRGCAAPVAAALVLAYAALLPVTLRLERVSDDCIGQTVRHEGRYIAGLAGREWPGRIP